MSTKTLNLILCHTGLPFGTLIRSGDERLCLLSEFKVSSFVSPTDKDIQKQDNLVLQSLYNIYHNTEGYLQIIVMKERETES